MKKPIALMLISVMVLMLSAFSFAGNGNSFKNNDLESKISADVIDEFLFITVWLDKEIGDELDELLVKVVEDEVVVKTSDDYDDFEEVEKFGTIMYMYTFDAIEYTPLDDFEVKVFVTLDDESELVLTKKVDLEDLDEEDDDDEEDEDDEEDMDYDMYPAAPAIANKLLKDNNIPNRVNGVNLIAAVAEEFADADKTAPDFADDVEDFLIDQLDEALDDLDDDIEDLSDLDEYFEKTDKEMVTSEVNKIKVKITDVDNNDDVEDDEEDDEDDDDQDDDDDEDEDDDDDDENHGKGGKK